jgi:hypothetical protein
VLLILIIFISSKLTRFNTYVIRLKIWIFHPINNDRINNMKLSNFLTRWAKSILQRQYLKLNQWQEWHYMWWRNRKVEPMRYAKSQSMYLEIQVNSILEYSYKSCLFVVPVCKSGENQLNVGIIINLISEHAILLEICFISASSAYL